MNFPDFYQKVDTTTAVDTLTESYGKKWEAAEQLEQAGPIMQFMASNDLIFVVLGVSLIIWLVLLTFLIRLDKKVTRLEEQMASEERQSSADSTTTEKFQ